MSDSNSVSPVVADLDPMSSGVLTEEEKKAVSTHVLVEEEHILKLRELSRRTRIAQSEYLREAVDDLLVKYITEPEPEVIKAEVK